MSLHTNRMDRLEPPCRTCWKNRRRLFSSFAPSATHNSRLHALLDLVHQRQIVAALAATGFHPRQSLRCRRDPDASDPSKPHILPTRNTFSPRRSEHPCHFLPGQTAWPSEPGTTDSSSSNGFFPPPKALVPPSPHNFGSPPAASHTQKTQPSPTTVRTRIAAPVADRNPVPDDHSRSKSPAHFYGHVPPLRSLSVRRLPPILAFPYVKDL